MAGGNLSPRQKMINMMYLVLTALLALNVSAEILKAFHLVEVSLDKSTANIEKKNEVTFKAIDKYHGEFASDANGTDIWNRAKKVNSLSDEMYKYVEDIKQQVIQGAEGRKEDSNGDGKIDDEELIKADDIENHANLLINNKKGEELKAKINKTREDLIALAPKDKQANIKTDLFTEDHPVEGAMHSWESVMFEHTPAAAVVTLLTKIQSDIRNTQAQVLDELRKSISDADFTFDRLEPKVIPNNGTFITTGSEYSADIFVAASSSKQEATITVNGRTLPVENGVGKYKIVPTSEGEVEYSGVISAKKPNGTVETYPFKSSFTALKPLAVISATKMNVVYIGLDNPISVSVPGYSPNDVSATCTAGGNLRPDKQKGTYLLKVDGSNREITVSASVKDKDGKVKKMGEQKYRVRQVPKPTPMLGAIKESRDVTVAELRTATFVYANLENFAFEGISFTPTKYTIVYQPKRGDAKVFYGSGNSVSPEIRAALGASKAGDRIIVGNISATGPAGSTMIPTSLSLVVK